MINWLQGHNTFGFRAFICHDGVFDPAQVWCAWERLCEHS